MTKYRRFLNTYRSVHGKQSGRRQTFYDLRYAWHIARNVGKTGS